MSKVTSPVENLALMDYAAKPNKTTEVVGKFIAEFDAFLKAVEADEQDRTPSERAMLLAASETVAFLKRYSTSVLNLPGFNRDYLKKLAALPDLLSAVSGFTDGDVNNGFADDRFDALHGLAYMVEHDFLPDLIADSDASPYAGGDVGILSLRLLDWPEGLPNHIAIPFRMAQFQIDGSWSYPNSGGLSELAEGIVEYLKFGDMMAPPPWEIRGIRWNDEATMALLPGETMMLASEFNLMLDKQNDVELQEAAKYKATQVRRTM